MVNRPAGGARSVRHAREPLDWYIEGPVPVRQLFRAIEFGPSIIYDPFCGRGNILDIAAEFGLKTIGSDLVDRGARARHPWQQGDFLSLRALPGRREQPFSIVTNPPYSYQPQIAERVIRHALALPIWRAAFLLPIAFVCGIERHRFFTADHTPWAVAFHSERPSCPPGSKAGPAPRFDGGMQDYCWLIYEAGGPHETRALWLPPG